MRCCCCVTALSTSHTTRGVYHLPLFLRKAQEGCYVVQQDSNSMISRSCSSFVGPTQRLLKTFSTTAARVGLMGICEDRNSSFLQGPSKAPTLIRNAFLSDAFNTWSELGINSQDIILDFGDVVPAENSHDGICRASHPVLNSIQSADLIPLVLGGDHSVSFSICKSISSFLQKPLTIVHFDAHPDIYDSFNGEQTRQIFLLTHRR